MTHELTYPVDITQDEDGFFLVLFPDFPEAATDGKTLDEAIAEARDCLEEALAGRMARHEDIPGASPARRRPLVSPGVLIAAKAALYTAVREQRVSNVALARRIEVDEREARRLLDPHHKSRIERVEQAFAAVGGRLVLGSVFKAATLKRDDASGRFVTKATGRRKNIA